MILTPEQYPSVSVSELLEQASQGLIGIDHRLLRAILDRGEAGVPDLVAFGLTKHERPVDLTPDILAMLRTLKSPGAMPFLLNLIREETEDLPDDVVDAVFAVGEPAIEPLLSLYEELGPEKGSEVAFLLAGMQSRDPRVLKLLTERIEHDPKDAVFCLGLHGDRAARPALEKLLELNQDDERFVQEIQAAIEDLEHAREPEAPVEFDIYDEYPESAQPVWEHLSEQQRLEFFESPSGEQRASAAAGFFNQELSDEVRGSLLRLAQNDPDPNVRGRAWETLYVSLDDPAVHEAMAARIKQQDIPGEELGGLLIGLSEIASEPEVRPVLIRAYEDLSMRAKALEAMWRSDDRRFATYFPPNLESDDVETKRQAIWGIGRLGIVPEIGRIRGLFEDSEFREDALFAYVLAAPGTVSPSHMRALFNKIEDLAGGLALHESFLVKGALDEKLMRHGHDPIFLRESDEDEDWDEDEGEEAPQPPAPVAVKAGRNDPCPCGSGKKFKKCCGQ